jgi:hypothetical protein
MIFPEQNVKHWWISRIQLETTAGLFQEERLLDWLTSACISSFASRLWFWSLSSSQMVRAACTVAAELSEQHPPVVSQLSATLSAYNAATCLQHASPVLDDASVGGNDATYLWTCSASPGSVLLPLPSLSIFHRDAS